MSGIQTDLRIALRSLAKSRMVTMFAVLTLALGIGATSAIFTVLDATLLKPPPYPEPDELVAVWGVMPNRDIDTWPASPDMVERYRREAEQFDDFAAGFGNQHIFKRRPDSKPEQITSVGMTWNLFEVLGVSPVLGRGFEPADAAFNPADVPAGVPPPQDQFNPPNRVMLSHAFWQDRFGADPSVVGSTLYLDDFPATIVGVMPAKFQLLMPGGVDDNPDLYEVLRVNVEGNAGAGNVFLNVIGRIRDGVTLQQAQQEIDAITARLRADHAIYRDNQFSNRLVALQDELTEGIDDMLLLIAFAVALVLLIACANVANLLLVRALSRAREQAVCTALGCGRWRRVRYALTEAGLVAVAGGVIGLGFAALVLPMLIQLQPAEIPQLRGLSIDARAIVFTALTVGLVSLLAGALPAAFHSDKRIAVRLRDRSGMDGGHASDRWRKGLVVGEITLAVAVLSASALLVQSFSRLSSADPGFDPNGVLTFNYVAPVERYPDAARQVELQRQFAERIRALPGVREIGGAFPLPLTGAGFGSRYAADLASFEDGSARQAQYRVTYPGYFQTLATPLVFGRGFSQADQDTARNVAVVNRALAERAWPGESPLGKTLFIRRGDRPEGVATEVIGMVEHQAVQDLVEEPLETVWFTSAFAGEIGFFTGFTWTVRTDADPMSLLPVMEQAMAGIDSDIPLLNAQPLQTLVDESTAQMRFSSSLMLLFGLLALLLAVVGLYGMLAWRVRQRLPEIGVRMAFGADAGRIFKLILGQGMMLVLIGLALGIALGMVMTLGLGAQLVGISATDPMTYTAIALLFACVALAACTLPAWRAAHADPMEPLRSE